MNINFILYGSNQANLIKQINLVPPTEKHLVTVKPYKSQRSLEQNRWARGFAKDWGAQVGYSPDEAYNLLMYKCNPVFIIDKETGEEIRLAGSFSKLNTAEAADVQEQMIKFGIDTGFFWDE